MFEIWAGMCLLVMVSQRGLCPCRTVGGRLPHSVLMQSLHNGWLKTPHCFISYLKLILFVFNLAPLWQQLVLFVAVHYLFSSLSPGFKLTSLSLALAYFSASPIYLSSQSVCWNGPGSAPWIGEQPSAGHRKWHVGSGALEGDFSVYIKESLSSLTFLKRIYLTFAM